ncbi:hypothetical protein SUDANB176_05529 [Streptomyces sp. enrichment culture]|uniref:hypothetical protein n=1 Tax=Streptomyces sp. enrichment culture TaxID=1795815 RepID=UPI003F5658B3
MAHLIQRVTDPRVFIDASTVDLVDEDLVAEFEPEWTDNGLVEAAPPGDSGIRILCGQEIGTVAVTAELWDAPPPLDPEGWQDVAEISVAWPSVVMDFGTTDPGGADALDLPGPGAYRVRVHGRNRDDGDPRDDHDPVEEYLIQVWPHTGPVTGPLTYKQTSRLGSRCTDAR